MEEKKKNWFIKHKIISAILLIIVIGIFTSVGGNKNNQSSTQSRNETTKEETKEPTKISATELADEFDANQVAAEKKWNGKYVEFSAEITNITDSGLSFSKVASKDFSFAQISCRITNKDQLLSLKNGETVTVRGTVGKQSVGVIDVSECEVVK
ncbi:MAG: hypothetical protein ABH812_04075 [bacterium]